MFTLLQFKQVIACALLGAGTVIASADSGIKPLKVDRQKVSSWNSFVDDLYAMHEAHLQEFSVEKAKKVGGYPDFPEYYEETEYFDKQSGKLLSRVKRVVAQPELVHEIEVNIYNADMQLQRDYLAAYLPYARNAPIQTLINLHGYTAQLHAFRQFDASGQRIYEQCRNAKNRNVLLSLDIDEFEPGPYQNKKVLDSKLYRQCFAGIPVKLDEQHYPSNQKSHQPGGTAQTGPSVDAENAYKRIDEYSAVLVAQPRNAQLLIQRGDLYLQVREFDLAVEDYSDAIEIDNKLDAAYFGRGMALGRSGRIKEGITDLDVYIKRNPDSSLAYTKRGVRYLWLGDETSARRDFEKALVLNPQNAEAHDDLGVIFARKEEYARALEHFAATVSIDPAYFKGYHNMAMVYYITQQPERALISVDRALALYPAARDSMLLKAQILEALGRKREAQKLAEEAEFLPEGNWTEHLSVK